MKQVVQNLRSGKTEVVDVPVPRPAPGAILVRTAASLVSVGTERMVVEFASRSILGKARSRPDLVRQAIQKARREGVLAAFETVNTRLGQPMVLGYSSSGTVVEVGSGVREFAPGDRVACAGGGHAVHAEFAGVPVNLAAQVPPSVDLEAAAFTTLGAIALHGFRLARAEVGADVLVIGLGVLGLLAVQIAAASGCRVFAVDLEPGRVGLARTLGAQGAAVRGRAERAALNFTSGRGFDAVLICADTPSNDPVEFAGRMTRDRGTVVAVGAVGLNLPRKPYYEREISFIVSRSYGPGRYDALYEEAGLDYPLGYVRWTENRNMQAVLEMMARGTLDCHALISHNYTIDQAARAYGLVRRRGGRAPLGVLFTYAPDAALQRTVPTGVPAASSNAPAAVRLAVLGSGNYATAVVFPVLRHVPGVQREVIVSAAGLSARQAAVRFGFARAASDESAALDDPTVNTIAVLTRHHEHARQTALALRAGKHVFCEKPLALDAEGLAQVASAAAAHPNLNLMVGFNRRFAPMVLALKRGLVECDEPPLMQMRINAGFLPTDHWLHDPAQGGGRLVGEACHFVDLLTFLAGAPPMRVHCTSYPDLGRYRQDNFTATLEFANGAVGSFTYTSAGDRGMSKEYLEVFCGGRAYVLNDFRSLESFEDGLRRVQRDWLRQDKGHLGAWRAFAESIISGGPSPIPLEELLAVHQATFALARSLETRGPEDVQPVPALHGRVRGKRKA
jgi:predicted dehydrogenase/threonine dehydrogenase-like Zn-dependent dehydrogenase